MTHFPEQKLRAHRELFSVLFVHAQKGDDVLCLAFFLAFSLSFALCQISKFASSPIETVAFCLRSRSIILICLLHGRRTHEIVLKSLSSSVSLRSHSFACLLSFSMLLQNGAAFYTSVREAQAFLHFIFRYNLFLLILFFVCMCSLCCTTLLFIPMIFDFLILHIFLNRSLFVRIPLFAAFVFFFICKQFSEGKGLLLIIVLIFLQSENRMKCKTLTWTRYKRVFCYAFLICEYILFAKQRLCAGKKGANSKSKDN